MRCGAAMVGFIHQLLCDSSGIEGVCRRALHQPLHNELPQGVRDAVRAIAAKAQRISSSLRELRQSIQNDLSAGKLTKESVAGCLPLDQLPAAYGACLHRVEIDLAAIIETVFQCEESATADNQEVFELAASVRRSCYGMQEWLQGGRAWLSDDVEDRLGQ